jgi:hypothetical protein
MVMLSSLAFSINYNLFLSILFSSFWILSVENQLPAMENSKISAIKWISVANHGELTKKLKKNLQKKNFITIGLRKQKRLPSDSK